MADIKDIISNIENIYGSNNSLSLLKDFERVIDELDVYVYENWLDGELVHRSAHVRLKKTVTLTSSVASF